MKTNSHISLIFTGLILFMLIPVNSDAQVWNTWMKFWDNPVMEGVAGSWNSSVTNPDVIFEDGIFKMWFTGGNSGNYQIGYAESEDGIDWDIYIDPVIPVGDLGDWNWIKFVGTVLHINDTLRMWYTAYSGTANLYAIGYAWSVEEHEWNLHPDPVLEIGNLGYWDESLVHSPSVYFDGTTYHMWYSGSKDFLHNNIGYATSTNGIDWDKDYVFSPVISYGPPWSFYGEDASATGQIVHNDTIRMFFGGYDGTNSRIGYAYSTDYTTWTVDNNSEPVVDVGEAGSWDNLHVCYPSVMVHDGQYKMWYNGGSGTGAKIGYAFTDPLVGRPDNKHSTQGKISISPNPLSTKARIEYELIEPGHVNLIIFNHIGQPIETLINQYQPRGQHQITWVAEGLASGIYFYSLQAGGQSATGKMVVLR